MIIYKITNLINNKCYIGQTIGTINKRWIKHCNSRHCLAMFSAINKYGRESFKIELLDKANSIEELNRLETKYIVELNTMSPNGYNLTYGGDNKKVSEETKNKCRNNFNKRTDLPKFKKGQVPWNKGLKGAQKAWNKSIPMKIDSKLKMIKSKVGKLNLKKCKPIFCIELKKEYFSIKEAAKELGLQKSHICSVLKNKRRHTGGFTFIYSSIIEVNNGNIG